MKQQKHVVRGLNSQSHNSRWRERPLSPKEGRWHRSQNDAADFRDKPIFVMASTKLKYNIW